MTDQPPPNDEEQGSLPPTVRALYATRQTMEQLIASTEGLASQDYVNELHTQQTKRQRRLFWTTVTFGVLGLLALTALIVGAVKIYDVADGLKAVANSNAQLNQDNKELNKKSQRAIDILIDCTTPTPENSEHVHKCFERSQAQTAGAIGQLNAITMAAAACIDQPHPISLQDVRSCVEQSVGSLP